MRATTPTVILIEDDPHVRYILARRLRSAGYRCVEAPDEPSLWRTVAGEVPDALVLDLVRDGAEDWGMVERLRGDSRLAAVPTVITTGLMRDDVIDRAERLGCRYLRKPFSLAQLLDAIQPAPARRA